MRSRSALTRSLSCSRQSSTSLRASFGGLSPVRASRASRRITSDKWRILALGDAGEAALAAMLPKRRAQILAHARHGVGADRLEARLLDRVEDVAGEFAARRLAAVDGRVVVAQLERDGVGLAAHLRDLVGRQVVGRQRQLRLAAEQAMLAGREADRQLVLARDRAHRGAGDALELLGAGFLVGHGGVSAGYAGGFDPRV